ncbi:methionine/alanine import family NSS transporter small subunit [Rossellomorea marisflavi]|uniref:Methionine/alanine import family NSS transporter small subunit n=1 Tax=Rossellomorea marisflavi TaxID=189381 RepID=A0A5D4RQE1_9BACI|nr:methionine/alanine import family NSS transporter small subunit [Rossellomorea marisflavi]MCM2605158.1 methionine/alanine import family NSS transporter small subunit [Rossellomorea marisflavi]MDW4527894.1 methionine/alanine import family NSS transporter small subunit [Rossellomorea marisflavi]QHA37437.1 methionine/alanine import family NSS transporter small subunit [Rossellomorea marisflavi]TYO69772.1 methionine/alanine import family NSS transporter small subunit [Rossellomorea marisflavi]TY
MGTGAIISMIVGIVIIWGGLVASIANAVISSKKQKQA